MKWSDLLVGMIIKSKDYNITMRVDYVGRSVFVYTYEWKEWESGPISLEAMGYRSNIDNYEVIKGQNNE